MPSPYYATLAVSHHLQVRPHAHISLRILYVNGMQTVVNWSTKPWHQDNCRL